MTRFRSLGVTDHDVRLKLRERLRQGLPARTWTSGRIHDDEEEVDDVAAVALLQDTQVTHNSARASFEARYAQLQMMTPEMPDLAEAAARGWVRVVDGQAEVRRAAREYLRRTKPPCEDALIELAQWSWQLRFTVSETQLRGPLSELAARLQDLDADNVLIPVRSPAWVAARLWDHAKQCDLKEWTVKWRLLGAPDLSPDEAWSAPAAAAFVRAGLDAAAAAGLETWEAFVDTDRVQRLRDSGDVRVPADDPSAVAPGPLAPSHVLGKLLALYRPHWGPEEGGLASLAALRLATLNLARREFGRLPHSEVEPLVRLADVHPQVLELIEDVSRQEPPLLADLLMHRKTAVAAAYLVATWPPAARSEDEEGEAQRELRVIAFAEAMLAVSDLVHAGEVDPIECADLLVVLQNHRHKALAMTEEPWTRRMSRAVAILRRASPDFQSAVLARLGHCGREGAATPAFTILLEAMAAVAPDVASAFHPSLCGAYKAAIEPEGDVSDLESMPAASAQLLVRALIALGDDGVAVLRAPVPVAALLAAASNDDSRYRTSFQLARSVRAHLRILARAAALEGEAAPPALVEALENVIVTGALAHAERGRVAAFSSFNDRLLFLGRRQRPIADEVAQAANRLGPAHRRRIVNALLRMDEPGVLAELSRRLPAEFRSDIERRIEQLAPGDAGRPATLPELQQTIQQLLGAGLPDAAERFMAVEESVATLGHVRGRTVERFRAQLFASLVRKQYDRILTAKLPEGLSPEDKAQAQEVLDHHQGLVYLESDAHRDATKAQALYRSLHARSPGIKAYAINLLAARVGLVLPDDLFAKAVGDGAERARHALAEAKTALALAAMPPELAATHAVNVATLQLSLGSTADALQTLRDIPAERTSAVAAALEAVARSREGLPEQALLFLKQAQARFGSEDVLEAAGRHIRGGPGLATHPLKVVVDATVIDLRQAFYLFKMQPAPMQAQVHVEGRGVSPLEALLTEIVRDALTTLVNLVPVFDLHQNTRHEDAINTLVRETFRSELSRWFGWSVMDQSLGGPKASGRWGERDLVIAQNRAEIAVIEGMRFSSGGRSAVVSHLRKLPAYANCNLYFLVVYAHEREPRKVLDLVEDVALHATSSLRYRSHAPLIECGNQPSGLAAQYEDASGKPLTVVFLVVDLLQHGQRVAIGAALAAATATSPTLEARAVDVAAASPIAPPP